MVTEIARKQPPNRQALSEESIFATAMPTLWPHMIVPAARPVTLPYPFSAPEVHYFYFARNGVYEIARHLELQGQEVLFPAYCHGVELEALLAAGARPKFYPVRAGMRVEVDEVAALIGPETKAIYLIHYVGFPGPVVELRRLCDERGLWLIEDCALALLSSLGERPLGSFGDASVFCLYKTVPAPNGGAVVWYGVKTAKPSVGQPPSLASLVSQTAASLLLNFEMRSGVLGHQLRRTALALGKATLQTSRADRVATGTQHFDPAHVSLAISDFSLAVITTQDFAAVVERRRFNYLYLLAQLRELLPPLFTELSAGVCPLFYPLQVNNKPAVMARLRASGVETIDFWRTRHPAISPEAFPEVEQMRQHIIWLPCHQDLTPRAIERLATVTQKAIQQDIKDEGRMY
jgi:perosamine synthetase